MTEPTIVCPRCQGEIKLTESLAAPLVESTRREYQAKLELERKRIGAEEARRAADQFSHDLRQKIGEIEHLQVVLKARDSKLAEAQRTQAEFLQKERQLSDERRELELTIEKRVRGSLVQVHARAKQEAEESLKLKVTEKEQVIQGMQKQIEDLKRRAEQGSQQLQGEVQELELEAQLAKQFPADTLEPVRKGEFGGDLLQRVISGQGQRCGAILWEAKRTKNWSDGWLPKLREDQRNAKAEIAVLVSQALPKDVESFELMDGVWVTHPRTLLPMACLLRHSLIEVESARRVSDGIQTKAEMVYEYLTGPRFNHRVQAIVEAFTCMQDDLKKEKNAMIKQWAKREEQIGRVMQSTLGMYGDLQGIAGQSIQEIEGLDWELGDGSAVKRIA